MTTFLFFFWDGFSEVQAVDPSAGTPDECYTPRSRGEVFRAPARGEVFSIKPRGEVFSVGDR